MKDYRDGKTFKSETEASKAIDESDAEYRDPSMWWCLKDETQRANQFINYCRTVQQSSRDREQAYIRHARLYENVEINSLTGVDYAVAIVRQAMLGTGIITFNVVQACIDTLAAKIAKNKPRPEFQTSGGSWKSQIKARKLNRWVNGFFYETDIYEQMKPVFIDAEVFGKGALHVFKNNDTKRLEVERVLPSELFVDESDGMYGQPRQLLRRKMVQREVLAAMFPEHRDDIMKAPRTPAVQSLDGNASILMVEVWEGWHLPSTAKAGDGKHIISIQGVELLSEDWKVPTFPFVFLASKKRVVGFWGKGTAESLVGIQLEINRLIRSISEILRRKGKGRTYIERGAKIQSAHMTNGFGDLVEYTGKTPFIDSSNAVSQEDYMQLDRLYQKAFQEVGISELSAAARKPAGLDAGVALREFSDIESERFALKHQAWDNAFLEVARIAIGLITKQHTDLQKGYSVRAPGRRRAIEVDWKDINLDEESYVMQMFPASSLPQTPAARKQFVKELEADGMISKAVAKKLLNFPDVDAEMDLGNAAIDDVDATISAILDDDKPTLHPPEPFQNLQLLVERATANYLFARHFDDIEPERLELLRNLIELTTAELARQAQAMQPPAPPMAAPPAPPAEGPSPMPNINVSGPQVNMPPAPAVPPLVAA